jgi:hypothetical protein
MWIMIRRGEKILPPIPTIHPHQSHLIRIPAIHTMSRGSRNRIQRGWDNPMDFITNLSALGNPTRYQMCTVHNLGPR